MPHVAEIQAIHHAGTGDGPVWPLTYALYHAAHLKRSAATRALIVVGFRAIGAFGRRLHARYRQRRQARTTRAALHELDDRALQDLGFTRDEIASIAAEATGQAERTRLHVMQTLYEFQK
jgi:uncharacterized protein YjiS (DUF1127 family)